MVSSVLPENLRLIEVSWEVCNKVGGIHTVLTTKLPHALRTAPGGYLAIGPYYAEQARSTFKELPLTPILEGIATALKPQGVTFRYGHWLVPGNPETILLSWDGLAERFDDIKKEYWDNHQLNTLHTEYHDTGEPLLWSRAVAMFVELYSPANPGPILLHLHEWLAGGALLYLKGRTLPDVRTVFTTHATILGRSLTSRGDFIYDKLDSYDPDKEAENTHIVDKFQLERLSARYATIFTTVSEITAGEATAFLGRKPEVVTENGVDLSLFPDADDLVHRRRSVRKHLNEIICALFFPQQVFNLRETSYQYTMGRYEFHNKGYDVYLESLADLNNSLKERKSPKTVISLFLVPGDAGPLTHEAELKLATHRLAISRITESVEADPLEWLTTFWSWADLASQPTGLHTEIATLMSQLTKEAEIPVSPYELPEHDPIAKKARELGLLNRAEDRVKIIFMPLYLTGLDAVFGRSLYDLVCACDLGVFSSTYEPWGYTPMESIVLGVPGVTSSLAGFGRAIRTRFPSGAPGVTILNRDTNDPAAERAALSDLLLSSTKISGTRRAIQERLGALTTITQFEWEILYEQYRTAYQQAFA